MYVRGKMEVRKRGGEKIIASLKATFGLLLISLSDLKNNSRQDIIFK